MRATHRFPLLLVSLTIALFSFAGSAFAAAPPYDNFDNAQPLEDGARTYFDASLIDATRESGEPVVDGSDTDHTLWFRWKATASGTMRASTCEDDNEGMAGASLAIYTGGSIGSLSSSASEVDNCGGVDDNARATAAVTAGQTYFIQVGAPTAMNSNTGVRLSIDFGTSAPANDNFAAAQDFPTLPGTVNIDNSLATSETGEPNAEPDSYTNGVWFKWTATQSAPVTFDTCTSKEYIWAPDSRLTVFTEGGSPGVNNLTQTVNNDDGCDNNSYMSFVQFNAVLGTTYYVRVSNYSDQFGAQYALRGRWLGELANLAPPRVNDQGAIAEGGAFSGGNGRWTADSAITYTYQWERCDFNGDNCADVSGATSNTYTTVAGDVDHTFRIRVTASANLSTQTIRSAPSRPVAAAPPNDDIENATDLVSAFPTAVNDDNHLSGTQASELAAPGASLSYSVWYRWTAPGNGLVAFDLCEGTGRPDSLADYGLSVYTGNGTIAGSTAVGGSTFGCGSWGRPRVTLSVVQGTTYWIQVGSSQVTGHFRLAIKDAITPVDPGVPAAVDPVPAFKLAKLGTVKPSRSGKFKLKKLLLTCGPTATGKCAGTLTIKTAKTKAKGRTVKSVKQTFKLSVAAGGKAGTSYKLNKKVLAALKSAKKLKASVSVKFGAPGFSLKSASTSLTLKK